MSTNRPLLATSALVLSLVVCACGEPAADRDDPGERQLVLPAPDEEFLLGSAGAPQPLFGDAARPTFASGFAELAAHGFNRFLPVFLTNEDGTGTDHPLMFLPKAALPEEAFGPIPSSLTCEGAFNPWAAAPSGLKLLVPGTLLVMDSPVSAPLDRAVLRARLRALVSACLGGDASRLGGVYLHDEPANNYVTSRCCDEDPSATFVLDNVRVLAEIGREVTGAPTMLVEAPTPFVLDLVAEPWGIPLSMVPSMTSDFWTGVGATAPHADQYGFDVYPVDLVTTLQPIADYLAHARARAPQAEPLAVLQAFGASDMEIDVGTPSRRPTRAETRAMAFVAVIHGAKGIHWYGQSALVLGDALWDYVTELVGDLRELSGVFALPSVSLGASPVGVHVAGHRGDGVTFVMLAEGEGRATRYELPVSGRAQRVVDVLTGEVLGRDVEGSLAIALTPYDARALAIIAAE